MLAPLASSARSHEGAEPAHKRVLSMRTRGCRGGGLRSSLFAPSSSMVTDTSVGPLHPGSLLSNNTQPGAGGRQTPGPGFRPPVPHTHTHTHTHTHVYLLSA